MLSAIVCALAAGASFVAVPTRTTPELCHQSLTTRSSFYAPTMAFGIKSAKAAKQAKAAKTQQRRWSFERSEAGKEVAKQAAAAPKFSLPKELPSMPKIAVPKIAAPKIGNLPKMPAAIKVPGNLPFLKEPELDLPEEEEEEDVAAPPVPKGNLFEALAEAIVSTAVVLAQAAIAKAQLTFYQQLTKLRNAVSAKLAEIAEIPDKLSAETKQKIREAPFYAQAAVELAVEESKAAIEALQKEAARAVEDAPRYYTEQVDNAVAELLAKPKAMLEDAKAASDEALSAAKATRDGLQKK